MNLNAVKFSILVQALNNKLLTEQDIDVALKRVLDACFRLCLFDIPRKYPYLQIPDTELEMREHSKLALDVARASTPSRHGHEGFASGRTVDGLRVII